MWAPFYVAFDGLDRLFGGPGASEETGPRAGPAYFATTFWIAIGLMALMDLLGRLGASRRERFAIPLLTAAMSPLPAYVSYAPDMSHGCAFAASALFLSACEWCHRTARVDSARWLAPGLLLGLLFLVRWQDATLGLVPGVLIVLAREDGKTPAFSRRAVGITLLLAGLAVGVLPQLAAWESVYDTWWLMPGDAQHVGEGGGFISLANVRPLAFFFSTWNGAFLSHPALLLCIAGLASAWPKRRSEACFRIALLAGITLHVTSSMLVGDWWSGGSFGQRRFVSLLPMLSVGLLVLWRAAAGSSPALRRTLVGACALLTLWNGLSLVRLHDGSLPYNPADPSWYGERDPWDHYDFGRRFHEILVGVEPPEGGNRLRAVPRTF
jgi:hypothetical protein